MNLNQTLLTTSALFCAAAVCSAADITGKITLKGTPPAAVPIAFDENCGALHTIPLTTRHYVVGKDNGLANVLVYVKSGLTEKNFKAPATAPLINQVGCMYEPYVTGLMVGQKLKIKNSDMLAHNVHALPDPDKGNKEFNDMQPQGFADIERSFDKPEVLVKFKCDVHGWMFAYVAVLDNPYFAVTDKDGNFTIKGLPNGKYTIVAFHEKTHRGGAGISQEVTVDGDKKVDYTVEVPAAK